MTKNGCYLFAGAERESSQPYKLTTKAADGTSTVVPYGYGNRKYSNSGCSSETAAGACIANERAVQQATTGFWNKPYIGNFGTIRWGLQYSRTEFKSFRGVGGSPLVIENMVFASFRYYPFNK